MDAIDRRQFLRRASAAAAGVGVLAAVPALPALAGSPGAASGARLPAGATLDTPVVARVRDLATGEVSVYAGTREITVHDRDLAARLFAATR